MISRGKRSANEPIFDGHWQSASRSHFLHANLAGRWTMMPPLLGERAGVRADVTLPPGPISAVRWQQRENPCQWRFATLACQPAFPAFSFGQFVPDLAPERGSVTRSTHDVRVILKLYSHPRLRMAIPFLRASVSPWYNPPKAQSLPFQVQPSAFSLNWTRSPHRAW